MIKMLIKLQFAFVLIFSIAFSNTFGPYTADDNTVILMNFDSDHSNAGNGGDATVVGEITYTDAGKHGNAAYFNNGSVAINDSTIAPADTSYLMFADHSNLDLEESWTIEFWAKSKARNPWSSNMHIFSKPDTAVGTVNPGGNGGPLSNYEIGINGTTVEQHWRDKDAMLKRAFGVGDVAGDYDSTSMSYPWVHVTWIHDYDSRFDAVFVHDVNGALIDYGYSRFHAGTSWNEDRWYEYTPTSMGKAHTHDLPAYVGVKAANMAGFDGWLDEFRVSNVVRGFDNAPVLAEHGWANGNPGYLGKRNPYTGAGTHTVNIDVTQFSSSGSYSITGVELFYNSRASLADSIGPGDASFQSVQMTHSEGVTWTGSFPIGARGTYHEYYFHVTDAAGNVHPVGYDAEGGLFDREEYQAGKEGHMHTVVVVDENSLVLDMNFETEEADGDPADNSVYGWNVDVYGDFAIGDEVPDESFGLQESEASFQWLDGVPSYIEIRDGQALHGEEYTFSAYFNLGHDSENLINHNLILMATQNGGRYNQDGSAWWLDNYAIQVQEDGAGGARVWNYSCLLGDLSDSWCYLLAQQSNQHYSVAPQEWWNMVSSFEFDADASSGHFYSLVINEDMEVKTFFEWDMQVAPTKFHGIWRLGTRGGAGAHNWPVGYADNIKVWNYAITPDDDPDGIFHGKTPDAGDASLAVGDDKNITPDVFELSQNYPNPFNPTTSFDLSLSRSQVVDFAIYNLMGQRVKTLVARSVPSGIHKISWDGKSMNGKEAASGLYIAKAIGDDFNFQKKITLLR
jgi:hypothetical protein